MSTILSLVTFVLAIAFTFAPTAAYRTPPAPYFEGRRDYSELGVKGFSLTKSLGNVGRRFGILPRQGGITSGPCGPGVGACADGYCCSEAGYCGQGSDYCVSPGCQLLYGPACEGNTGPSNSVSTADVARPALGSVPYGGMGIYSCNVPGAVAVTHDDGPSAYTADLLDKLKGYGARATFFVVGNNGDRGMINDAGQPWGSVVQRMVAEGHQVASHTWTHENSSQLDEAHMTNQMVWNEMAFNDILGYFPTYMRPPYSICSPVCETVLSKLGYHIVYFDLDTQDYLNDDVSLIQNSKDIWDQALTNADAATKSFLEIGHDIHYQTVYNLTDYILTSLQQKGYNAVTVGECLGDPKENWYRQGPASSSRMG